MDDEIILTRKKETDVLTDQLVDAIKRSDEYINYHKCLEEVKKQPEMYEFVNEFRRRNFQAQNNMGGRMSYDEYSGIYNMSTNLRQNTLINDFLNAEIAVAKMMQRINYKIIDSIKFEIDFLN